jgi:uncharacterized protein
MRPAVSSADQGAVPFPALLPFLLFSFGLAWGILLLFILLPDPVTAIFGALSARHPLFILAVYAPAIAAIIVVLRHGGTTGLRRYLSRLLLWRCSIGRYAVLIVGIPLLFLGGALLTGNLGEDPWPLSGVGSVLAAMAFMLVVGPVEALGWRGVALPLLQQRVSRRSRQHSSWG